MSAPDDQDNDDDDDDGDFDDAPGAGDGDDGADERAPVEGDFDDAPGDDDVGSAPISVGEVGEVPKEAGSGFIEVSEAPAVVALVTVDRALRAGEVRITSSLLDALRIRGRGRAWANTRDDALRPAELSPEEKLLRAIFGEKAQETVELVGADVTTVKRGDALIKTPADGSVFFAHADSAAIDGRERKRTKGGERIVLELRWSPPVEVGDVVETVGGDALGVIVGVVVGVAGGTDERRCWIGPSVSGGEKLSGEVVVKLRMPGARERAIARSIGPYSRVTGRPAGDCATFEPAHVQALVERGCARLVDELAWRSSGGWPGTRIYERIVKGEDPADDDRTPVPTLALTHLQALATTLGFCVAVDERGLTLTAANLGASRAGGAPGADVDDGSERRKAPEGGQQQMRDIFSFFEKRTTAQEQPRDTRFVGAWSRGEVKKPETLNYRTMKPEHGGLFCERIFGPVNDYECHCGKYRRMKYRGVVCEKCGVEVIQSRVRAERFGHVTLASWIVPWPYRRIISELIGEPLHRLEQSMLEDGGEALQARLAALPSSSSPPGLPPPGELLWRVVPVLPPGSRPLIALPGGRFMTSDLNDLYRRVINRNNRVRRLIELNAPQIILMSEREHLQHAVDALLANSEQAKGRRVTGPGKEPLVDVATLFWSGVRMRERGVDYAARAAALIEDRAHGSVSVPQRFAMELLKPWLYARLEREGYVSTIKSAKQMLMAGGDVAVAAIRAEALGRHVVICAAGRNGVCAARIDALHEEPVVRVDGAVAEALDIVSGDEVVLHLPLSEKAREEAALLADSGGAGPAGAVEGWMERAAGGLDEGLDGLARLASTAPSDAQSVSARLLLVRGC